MRDRDGGAFLNCAGRGMKSKLAVGAVALSALSLAGCAGPTYGTGKPAEQQLVDDLTGILSLGPKDRPQIDYRPRPGLVKPPSMEVLPPPQEDVAAAGNPAWPESPEERLARVRAEATANQNNPLYRPNVIHDLGGSSVSSAGASAVTFSESNGVVKTDLLQGGARSREAQRQAFLKQKQEVGAGSPTTRRYLSDPPVDLRQPAPTAPAGVLGKDEAKKERAAKAAATKQTGGLRRLIPWLN